MEKEVGFIRVTETPKGMRFEVEGDYFKGQKSNCCCLPVFACTCKCDPDCCTEESSGK
ncbi:MAG: hypothetical protein P1R58_00690 [bacterium]|nr:hypothetical protein [bacterium]